MAHCQPAAAIEILEGNSGWKLALLACSTIGLFFIFVGMFGVISDHDPTGWVWVSVSLPLALFAVLSYRARLVELDATGLTFRTVWRTTRIEWSEITSVETTGHRNPGNNLIYYLPTLRLRDGTTRLVSALGDRSSTRAEHLVSRIERMRRQAK